MENKECMINNNKVISTLLKCLYYSKQIFHLSLGIDLYQI